MASSLPRNVRNDDTGPEPSSARQAGDVQADNRKVWPKWLPIARPTPCSRWHAARRVWFIGWITAVAASTYFWLSPLGDGVSIPIDIANGASIAVLFVTGIVCLFLKERAMGITAIAVSLLAVFVTVDAVLHYHTFPR